jgi:hypothetical protein
MSKSLLAVLLLSPLSTVFAQSDTINGLDVKMKTVNDLQVTGREGTFPDGMNGLAFASTVCNTGIVDVEWKGPMRPHHPFITFIVGREVDGRFVQISDRSWMKHTFAASNFSDCSQCSDNSDSSVLAIGCSDTYGSGENGDPYWLAPLEEVDPWLGDWDPNCSQFDKGEPPVAPPKDCDGVRSLTRDMVNKMGPVLHRINVSDADLDVDGAAYYIWGQYLIRGEADDRRDDNGVSRDFSPTWSGSHWDLSLGSSQLHGTILKRWTGATIRSDNNHGDDGRVFLASVVTGPDATTGRYHYEYAANNRDNSRGIKAIHIPLRPDAKIYDAGFRDIDSDPTNDWTFKSEGGEAVWSTDSNPLLWNVIYNFWFDSDMPPSNGNPALLEEHDDGAGFPSFDIPTASPMGPSVGNDLGSGKQGSNGLVPDLAICGGLDVGESAQLMVRYALPDALTLAFVGHVQGNLDYHGGTIVPFPPDLLVLTTTDHAGRILQTANGSGGSFDLFLQFVVLDPGADGGVAMTNALELVR